MTEYVRVLPAELERFTLSVLKGAGMRPDVAEAVTESLVQGELHGLGSHGVSRLLAIYCERVQKGSMNGDPSPRTVNHSASTTLIDADNAPGAFVGMTAMKTAIELAQKSGCGVVGVRQSSHFGAAFIFARQAVTADMIGMATTAAIPMVLPAGGTVPALGTNPLCFGIPGSKTDGIMLDMATSVVARGKIQLAVLEEHDIPEGWAVTKEGRPTTNAQAAKDGYLLPLGGYKGYGLALIAEVLSSVLTGAMMTHDIGGLFSNTDQPQAMGHLFAALDISRFMPIESFKDRVDEIIFRIKATPRQPDIPEILIPGEPERAKAAENRRQGIPIATNVMRIMHDLATRYNTLELETI